MFDRMFWIQKIGVCYVDSYFVDSFGSFLGCYTLYIWYVMMIGGSGVEKILSYLGSPKNGGRHDRYSNSFNFVFYSFCRYTSCVFGLYRNAQKQRDV
ncbi:hypothetical protein LCGC14_2080290 [marine sediment metagenome]|uniref:Uncharacterized protein n=1 Tax=marine sediment metagenome TaxID=412755 RepID=A0A0F9EFP5_9ZZZZ